MKKDADFIRGYHFGGKCFKSATTSDDAAIGAELKEALTEPGGWQMSMYSFGECLPYAENRITLNH